MKIVAFIFLLLFTMISYAEVYKCVSESGRVYYQSRECPQDREQSQINIKHYDKKKIAEAQKRSAKAIADWQQAEKARKTANLRESEMRALEGSSNAVRGQGGALNSYTKSALFSNHGRSRGLYYQQSDLLQ